MATFYVGYRPVLRGRNANNFVHSTKNKVGVYSNYSLMDNAPKLLAGFPDNAYVMGTYKQALLLEYIAAGKPHIAPMKDPGSGTRLSYGRFRPYENKGLEGAKAFPAGYGHAIRGDIFTYSNYSNYIYDGLAAVEALKSPGHAIRYGLSYGGPFKPYINQGITPQALAGGGQAVPATAIASNYGHNRVNEWRGLPSSKAL